MLLINVILLLVTIGLQLNLIVSIVLSSNQQIIELSTSSENKINLINDWTNSTIPSNQINYTTSWLTGDNLKCNIQLETNYGVIVNGYTVNKLIVWYQVEGSPAIQLWMDSNEKLNLFSREYSIDLPLIRNNLFRLIINFQSNQPLNYAPQLIKRLEVDLCWHTYQPCPVLSCLTNGSHNEVSCTFNPNLSFNCSTGGLCIHRDEVCDYEINCPDSSDEINCDSSSSVDSNLIANDNDNDSNTINNNSQSISSLRCSFEDDYCSWKPMVIKSTNEFCPWKNCSQNDSQGLIRTISSNSLTDGPTFDHTLGTSSGHYLILKAKSKSRKSIGSIGTLMPIGGYCKLIFYYLTNSHSGQVLIRSSENSSSLNPFSTIEVVHLEWEKSLFTRVEVEIDLGSPGEYLFLVAMVKGEQNSTLAIDDLYFTKGCYPIPSPSTSSQPLTLSSSSTTFTSS